MHSVCLIVETNPMLAYLLARYAETAGMHPRQSPNFSDALAYLAQEMPALILLSTRVAGVSGWQALQQFKDIAGAHLAPVLMVSCLDERWRMDETGRDECLVMPLSYQDFNANLAKVGIALSGQK